MSLIPGASGVAASFPDGFTVSNGTVTAPGYKFSDSQTGFYRPATNEWALASNGVQSMLVNANGAFTFGPVSGTPTISHLMLGNLKLSRASALSPAGYITSESSTTIGANYYFDQNVTQDRTYVTGGASLLAISATTTPSNTVFAMYANTNSITANSGNANTGLVVIGSATGAGAWTLGNSTSTLIAGQETASGVWGIKARTSAGAGGSLVLKSGQSSGGANVGGVLYLAAGRGGAGGVTGSIAFGESAPDDTTVALNSTWGTINNSGGFTFGTNSTPATTTADSSPISGYAHHLRGTTTATDQSILLIQDYQTTGSDARAVLTLKKNNGTTSTAQRYVYFSPGAGLGNGMITGNGANNATFGVFSDARLKNNVENLPSQLSNICSLRPVEFDYMDGSGHQIGFIAQEIESIYPDCVSTESDGEQYKVVSGWSKTEARLVKAIQELKAELDEAKAEIEILKGVN